MQSPVDIYTYMQLHSAELGKRILSSYPALHGADALVIITEWDQFRALDLDRVKRLMRTPLVVDLRNIYRPAEIESRGFQYRGIGRG